MNKSISFIHLSDIHFNKNSGDKYDIDSDLRNEIELDIKNHAYEKLENIAGILVCGDIAFSGREEEYRTAQEFLDRICKLLAISADLVFCVPGNHDVDQNIPRNSSVLHLVQDEIEKINDNDEISAKLAAFARDTSVGNVLYKHIETYNAKFSGKYGCNINSEKPCWQQSFLLDNGITLCIHGMNSTIISSADDHKNLRKERLMVLGEFQIPQRQDNVVYLTLCHHPPECWKDPDNIIKTKINERVSVQLYGHKHVQTIESTLKGLKINSGATHPSHQEDEWIPRYNWLSICVENSQNKLFLKVRVYPRIYQKSTCEFLPEACEKGHDYMEYLIPIDKNTKNINKTNGFLATEHIPENKIDLEDQIQDFSETRKIAYQFLNLSFITRASILNKFKLLDDGDEGIKHVNLLPKIIKKAKDKQCFEEFCKEIEEIEKER